MGRGVRVTPVIFVSNQLVGAPLGTDVTIDCQIEAHPRAINYWVFNDSMLGSVNKHCNETSENGYKTHMKLTVKNLQPSDFGAYKCISKNPLGDTEGTIRLYEITMPSASPREREAMTSRADEGHNKDVTETSIARPTKSARKSEEIVKKHSRSPPPSGKQYFNSAGSSTTFNWSDRIRWLFMTTLVSRFHSS